MNTFLLFCILIALLVIIAYVICIDNELHKMNKLPETLVNAGHDLADKSQALQDALDTQPVEQPKQPK